jgi:hypothetical protein
LSVPTAKAGCGIEFIDFAERDATTLSDAATVSAMNIGPHRESRAFGNVGRDDADRAAADG